MIIYDSQPILLQRPVSPYSTSCHGELQAIDLVLSHLLASPLFPSKTVTILTDCQSALQTVCNNRDPNSHHTLCSDIRTKTGQLCQEGWTLQIGWVAGHADLAGNELADQQAKEPGGGVSEEKLRSQLVRQNLKGPLSCGMYRQNLKGSLSCGMYQ